MKMYIAVLDEFPDYMTPTLVAHAVLGAHLNFTGDFVYEAWLKSSFKKCIVRVNQKEFDKICKLGFVYIAFERNTLGGKVSAVVVRPYEDDRDIPNVLKFSKLWKPI